jgi:hypothetical protein
VIRLIFDEPQTVHRIRLRFSEEQVDRTQEFTLRWSDGEGQSWEIIRQQWNFSIGGPTKEVEDYHVNLSRVRLLELTIKPEITHGAAIASLGSWRVGISSGNSILRE